MDDRFKIALCSLILLLSSRTEAKSFWSYDRSKILDVPFDNIVNIATNGIHYKTLFKFESVRQISENVYVYKTHILGIPFWSEIKFSIQVDTDDIEVRFYSVRTSRTLESIRGEITIQKLSDDETYVSMRLDVQPSFWIPKRFKNKSLKTVIENAFSDLNRLALLDWKQGFAHDFHQ